MTDDRTSNLLEFPFFRSCVRSIAFAIAAASLLAACGGGGSGDTDPSDGEGGDDSGSGAGDGSGAGSSSGGSTPGTCGTAPIIGEDQPDVVEQIADVRVTTIAGTAVAGVADGTGDEAGLSNPVNVLLTEDNEVIVADYDSGRLRLSTAAGAVTTLTTQAKFQRPFGMVWSGDGRLFVQTDYNEDGVTGGPGAGVIWEVDTASGEATPAATETGRPRGMATLPNGKIAVADIERHDIRIFDPQTGELTPLAGKAGCNGFNDGTGAEAQFDRPYGMVVNDDGDLLVADLNNHRIRKVTLDGTVSTVLGDGYPDMVDGDLASARLNMPKDLAIDSSGAVFVSDTGNHRIRRIKGGVIETVAGDGKAGFADGDGDAARFFGQEGLDVTADGKTIYVADGSGGEVEPYHRLRKITLP